MTSLFAPPRGVLCAADISEDSNFRWSLDRRWGEGPLILWIMLNPSRADGHLDDQTIATITRLGRRWADAFYQKDEPPAWWARFGGLRVVNLSPYRCTKPRDLIGNEAAILSMLSNPNLAAIEVGIRAASLVVGGWGDGPSNVAFRLKMRDPIAVIGRMLSESGKKLWCVDMTGERNPRHPLYCGNDRTPMEWPGY